MCVVLIRSHINIVLLTGGIVLEVCFSPLPMDESASNRKKKDKKRCCCLLWVSARLWCSGSFAPNESSWMDWQCCVAYVDILIQLANRVVKCDELGRVDVPIQPPEVVSCDELGRVWPRGICKLWWVDSCRCANSTRWSCKLWLVGSYRCPNPTGQSCKLWCVGSCRCPNPTGRSYTNYSIVLDIKIVSRKFLYLSLVTSTTGQFVVVIYVLLNTTRIPYPGAWRE